MATTEQTDSQAELIDLYAWSNNSERFLLWVRFFSYCPLTCTTLQPQQMHQIAIIAVFAKTEPNRF
jgi:hypothetical protein